MTYRPALDGLRAIAVVSVMLFHLDRELLPGGITGVDIFFVISGYLITSIVIRDFDKERFSFARFYQRRISRISPLFFLVSITIFAVTAMLYQDYDFALVGSSLAAAAVSLANMQFVFLPGEFEELPFVHYWSLSIEEQYYLIFPLILFLADRYRGSRKSLSIFLSIAALLSFIACIVLTEVDSEWAFFLLPTRAWELLAGCILAVLPFSSKGDNGSSISNKRIDALLASAGLVVIIASQFMIHDDTGFPGWIVAFPVFGTVLVIGRPQESRTGVTERLLSHPVAVVIGKASYSLYLWHWPVYAIVDYALITMPYASLLILKIVLTVTLSVASYNWVEKPVRSSLNRPERQRLSYLLFTAGTVVMLVTGYWARSTYSVNASLGSTRKAEVAFNEHNLAPQRLLAGDSNESMDGVGRNEIARARPVNRHVPGVSDHDSLPDSKLDKE
ncbi:acyltransferase [Chlorobaculum thiosulfatiphilum]|uniref:Acyltransferase n=1 Tax=Chlorobaculum thiosulfatiphilum TaxID=115852 RepID=A0A5C4S5Z4_CHLTI|nr:acyltransferase [Chlorobaculum thiosulfatiphilum]TNJ38597.1 acyltransferase [Chlorobaculum thiosulfatiphilum]